MSNRYKDEVAKRVLLIASNASDLDELRRLPEHPPGECVECDALRWLNFEVENGLSLHRIRRDWGGHGGSPDALSK